MAIYFITVVSTNREAHRHLEKTIEVLAERQDDYLWCENGNVIVDVEINALALGEALDAALPFGAEFSIYSVFQRPYSASPSVSEWFDRKFGPVPLD
jgi:hypothetical protein